MIFYLCLSHQLSLLFYILFLLSIVDKSLQNNKLNCSNNWTLLPSLSPFGSKMKLPTCTGCLHPIDSNSAVHKCLFHSTGFKVNSTSFTPCRVLYHPKCITIGSPFTTRHFGKGTKGLQYPPCATILPFICELCTTRTQLGRELDPLSNTDATLLQLE